MAIFVSASSLSDFLECKKKVYYRIFKPVVPLEAKEQIIGTITHKVLESNCATLDDAGKLASKLCAERNLDSLSSSLINNHVGTFYSQFKGLLKDGDLIEHRFKVKLWDDVFLVGVMDRVCDGVVYDWKTGSRVPTRLDNNVQFILYNLAYNILFKTNPSGLYFASLRTGQLVRYIENKEYSKELIGRIIPDFVSSVKSSSYSRTGIFGGACFRCPYKTHCLSGEENELDSSKSIEE